MHSTTDLVQKPERYRHLLAVLGREDTPKEHGQARGTQHTGVVAIVFLYSVPLVLGTPVMRGSGETAMRSARAVALKIASAMWWPLRP